MYLQRESKLHKLVYLKISFYTFGPKVPISGRLDCKSGFRGSGFGTFGIIRMKSIIYTMKK